MDNEKEGVSEVYSETFLLEMKTVIVVIAIIVIVVDVIYLYFSVPHHSLTGNSHPAAPETWKCG